MADGERSQPRPVIDASPVLAYLFGEPGGDIAAGYIARGAITSINLAEVIAKLIDRGADPAEAAQQVGVLPLNVIPVDKELGIVAGQLRSTTRAFGLSVGDRVAIALALRTGGLLITADRLWSRL